MPGPEHEPGVDLLVRLVESVVLDRGSDPVRVHCDLGPQRLALVDALAIAELRGSRSIRNRSAGLSATISWPAASSARTSPTDLSPWSWIAIRSSSHAGCGCEAARERCESALDATKRRRDAPAHGALQIGDDLLGTVEALLQRFNLGSGLVRDDDQLVRPAPDQLDVLPLPQIRLEFVGHGGDEHDTGASVPRRAAIVSSGSPSPSRSSGATRPPSSVPCAPPGPRITARS